MQRSMLKNFSTSRGFPFPFGPSRHTQGFNFALFSKHATQLSLCLFDPNQDSPVAEIALNPQTNKTGDVWHIFIYDLPAHYHYGYRASGPYDPLRGHLYDNRMILLDPYAKRVVSSPAWGVRNGEDTFHWQRGVVYPMEAFDWEDDTHPNLPLKDLIIYEMHVRGFTQDPSSGVKKRGTFQGIIEKIPYLKQLGINAVELMPIHIFQETNNPAINPETGEQLFNYWGYSTLNFFSPMHRYAADPSDPISEFKTLVKALHKANIEVILDVVFNHTSEGNEEGPIQSFKGLENSVYYMLAPNGEYYNFSGCGNTLNCNHPVVRELIRDSLRYWVTEMHVDGFRFDLASILTRSHDGIPLASPPLIEAISEDPILASTKLIAEAWDAGGLYQVGSFPGHERWSEWNGKFRDDVRRFIKGTDGTSGVFATRLSGSEDLYGNERSPTCSINFITSHDGFTLADLVSYNAKHNLSNGEENRDGDNNNESWNCGAEGQTEDDAILTLREKQKKNFLVTLLVSQGIPMLLMGDEYGHTKLGNNNTWCHDSRLNWFQWDTLEKQSDFFRFYSLMIAFRKSHPILTRSRFLGAQDVQWHGEDPSIPDWSSKSRFVAFSLPDSLNGYILYIAFNSHFSDKQVHLPKSETPWYQCVCTSNASPNDIIEGTEGVELKSETLLLPPHSVHILKTYSKSSG